MSDIETMGAQVRAIAAALPSADALRAARQLEEAQAGLTEALRDSVEPAGIPKLAAAKEHVDKAISQLTAACDRLDDYLTSIGLSTVSSAPASTAAAPAAEPSTATGSADWWRQRINQICDSDATTEPREVALTKLFSELVDLAGKGDRDGYRDRLLSAGPAVGVKLPGLAWPMIRTLSTDVFGRPAAAKDDERLRGFTRDRVRRLLPKLPEDVPMAQLHGACSLPHDNRDETGKQTADPPHPADSAAVGPALVAALLQARQQIRKDA